MGKKQALRWLWHALDHRTGEILAYVFGRREDQAFLELKALLAPFGIRRFYTDGWGAYKRHLAPEQHEVGKRYRLSDRNGTILVAKRVAFSENHSSTQALTS